MASLDELFQRAGDGGAAGTAGVSRADDAVLAPLCCAARTLSPPLLAASQALLTAPEADLMVQQLQVFPIEEVGARQWGAHAVPCTWERRPCRPERQPRASRVPTLVGGW